MTAEPSKQSSDPQPRSRDLLRAIVEASPVAIYAADLDHRITLWNPAAERVLGWTASEAIGRRDLDSIPENEAAAIPAVRKRLEAGERVIDRESKRIHKDGHILDVRLSIAATRDEGGEPNGFVVLVTDISESKRADRELHESLQLMRALFAASPQALIAIGLDAKVRTWNPAAERIFGYSADEVMGKPILNEGASQNEVKQSFDRLLAGDPQPEEEVVRTHRSGRRVELSVSRALLRDPNGGVTGMMTVAVDVTERNRHLAETAALQERLRRSETMSALGSIVAGVAHEVRNPLFAMTATVDALEARWGDRLEIKPYMEVLRAEAARLNRLMGDLLQLGKPISRPVEARPLAPVIAEGAGACQPLAAEAGVTIENAACSVEAHVSMVPELLVQVFQNLIQNGIQHSPRGGAIRLEAASTHDAHGRGWIDCFVRDSGPGFREEELRRAMEPFFSRRRGGTGLGLAIVQRIVDQHGGTITAGNRPEGGAVMTVRLPLPAT